MSTETLARLCLLIGLGFAMLLVLGAWWGLALIAEHFAAAVAAVRQ